MIQLHCDVVVLDEGSQFSFTLANSPATKKAVDFLGKYGMDTTALTLETRLVTHPYGVDITLGEDYGKITVVDQALTLLRWREEADRITRKTLKNTSPTIAGES